MIGGSVLDYSGLGQEQVIEFCGRDDEEPSGLVKRGQFLTC